MRLVRLLFLASAWTLFGVVVLADAAPPYTMADRVIAVLTVPGPFAALGLLVAGLCRWVWDGKEDD